MPGLVRLPVSSYQGGYITTATVLLVMGVLLVVGTSASLLAIDAGQLQLANEQAQTADVALDACIESALLEFNHFKTIPSSHVSADGTTCALTQISKVTAGEEIDLTFTATATASGYVAAASISAIRSDIVTVTNWQALTP